MSLKLSSWQHINTFSYVGLIITVAVWYFLVSPPKHTYSIILSVTYLLALLTPAYGLIKKSYRVYVWSSYIILIYFMHAIIETWSNADEKMLAIAELILSIAFFMSATVCAKHAKLLINEKHPEES